MIIVKTHFKNYFSNEFYNILLKDNKLLDTISSAQKYTKNNRRRNLPTIIIKIKLFLCIIILLVFKTLYKAHIYFVFYIIFIVRFTYLIHHV